MGELVSVSGMLSRPELNGMRGEVVNGSDDSGRVIVNLFQCNIAGRNGSSRKMRIQPRRLVPIGGATAGALSLKSNASSPALLGAQSNKDGDNRPASSLRSRPLSSAVGQSAKSISAAARSDSRAP